MKVTVLVLQSFQHDRFYVQGERTVMDRVLFDDLEPGGLVKEAVDVPEIESVAPKAKGRAK